MNDIKTEVISFISRVRAGSAVSNIFEQEMGVPQGSVLSPALFSIKINERVKNVFQNNDSSLFVDDFALCVRNNTFEGQFVKSRNASTESKVGSTKMASSFQQQNLSACTFENTGTSKTFRLPERPKTPVENKAAYYQNALKRPYWSAVA